VLLQLEHCDQLEREDLARMFGCSKPTISRLLHRASAEIEKRTLGYLREHDPWLELKWDDFVELCRTATPACFGLTD
jgi:transcriptional regulator with XRE-family HTH domain